MKLNFGRILANAFARRVAFLIVAALLAALGFSGKAHAQNPCPSSGTRICTQPQAFAAANNLSYFTAKCRLTSYGNVTAYPTIRSLITSVNTNTSTYTTNFNCQYLRSTDQTWQTHAQGYSDIFGWIVGQTCSTVSSQTTTRLPLGGSTQCINNCVMRYMLNADDETSTRSPTGATCLNTKDSCPVGTFYNLLMNVCQPIVPTCPDGQHVANSVCVPDTGCPEGMVSVQPSTPGAIATGEMYCKPKESECPPGNVKAPSGQCLPGEGQCAVGEAKKKDGTCGKDGNGDGVPDDEDSDEENDTVKETFSGGENCNAPPSCNGGPIDCGMARIQWRIECNTRRNANITGGSCTQVPICTGEKCDAVEYAQLMQQWRGTCALEKLANAEGSEPGSNDDLIEHMEGQRDAEIAAANANAAQGDGHEGVSESSIFAENTGPQFNPNLFGGGSPGMCSFSTTLELMGHPIELPGEFWTLAAMIGWLTVACAYLWVAFQLG